MGISSLVDDHGPRDTILTELVGRIESGDLEPGTKLLATSHLAKHYGVATKTAQSAVAELARRGYVTRQTGRGTFVADHRRGGGRSAQGATAALFLSCRGHVWGEFTASLAYGLGERGIRAELVDTTHMSHDTLEIAPEVDAIMGRNPEFAVVSYNHQARLLQERYPRVHVVCLESKGSSNVRCDRVTTDQDALGEMAAAHLLDRGYRRPACLVLETSVADSWRIRPDDEALLVGLNRRLAVAGLPPARVLSLQTGSYDLGDVPDAFESEDRPDVVVCSLAHRAMDLVKALRVRGIDIPADIGVIACSETPHTEALDLTAVDPRFDMIGRSCLDLIESRIQGDQDLTDYRLHQIQPRLVTRHSTPGPRA